jgi:hypothetical protein
MVMQWSITIVLRTAQLVNTTILIMLSVRLVKTLTVYLVNLIHSVLFLLNVINAKMDMCMILTLINVDLFVKNLNTSII